MLNTDATFKFDLNEDTKVCHLLNNFPQLTKCLYANLMYSLDLEKYFYEAVKFSPSWFMLQFLEEAIDGLRFSKTFDVIRQVKEIVEAMYTNICRMDFRYTGNSDQLVSQKIILGKLLDHMSSALRHYNTPCSDTEVTKSKNKTKEYLGHSLNYQLSMVMNCLKMSQNKPKFSLEEKFQIYRLMLEKEPELNNFCSNQYSPVVAETLVNINTILLNTLQNSVLNITLSDFVYWVEIDIEDNLIADVDLKRDNLQKSIGEQSYELIDILTKNPSLEHDVVKQLQTVSIKPKSLAEVAKSATIGTVLEKVETSLSRRVWMEELLDRKESLYCNTECLQTVIDNVELLDLKHIMKILTDYQEFSAEMDHEDEGQMREIFYKGGSRLEAAEITELIDELTRVLGDDYSLNSGDFEQEVTNYFNKITEDQIDEKIMWKLILKYPQKFYETLLDDFKLEDESQIATALKIISVTQVISARYVEDIITNHLNLETASVKSLKHLFLSGFFKLQIIERKEFIRKVLMQNFSQALASDNLNLIFMLLKVLSQIMKHLKVEDLLPPLMIQLAQIMDKYRWDIMSYSGIKEDIVDICSSIATELMKTVLKNGSKNDKEWIKAKIENCKPITKFYFQKLSLEKGDAIIPFDNFLHPGGFSNAPKTKITSFLCETIVRCTSKECKRLMSNETLQNFFTDALIVISVIAGKANETNPLNCLHKCVADYVKILIVSFITFLKKLLKIKIIFYPQNTIIPNIVAKNEESTLLKDIITLLKKLPSESIQELSLLFLEPLKMLNKCESFSSLIMELDDCELKKVLLE
jgi:hypothetical protein